MLGLRAGPQFVINRRKPSPGSGCIKARGQRPFPMLQAVFNYAFNHPGWRKAAPAPVIMIVPGERDRVRGTLTEFVPNDNFPPPAAGK